MALEAREDSLEGLRRAHHRLSLDGIRSVVPAQIGGRALNGQQLARDDGLIPPQRSGERREGVRELGSLALRCKLLSPEQCQVKMAPAGVDFANPAARRTVLVEEPRVG